MHLQQIITDYNICPITLQLKDLLRCLAAVECLARILNDPDIKMVLEKWSIIEEIVEILKIPAEITTAVGSSILTMSDLYGDLLRMELKLKKFSQNQSQQTNLAEILLDKFNGRRKNLIENPVMKSAIWYTWTLAIIMN